MATSAIAVTLLERAVQRGLSTINTDDHILLQPFIPTQCNASKIYTPGYYASTAVTVALSQATYHTVDLILDVSSPAGYCASLIAQCRCSARGAPNLEILNMRGRALCPSLDELEHK